MSLDIFEFQKALKDEYILKLNILVLDDDDIKPLFYEKAGPDGQMDFIEFARWIIDEIDKGGDDSDDEDADENLNRNKVQNQTRQEYDLWQD